MQKEYKEVETFLEKINQTLKGQAQAEAVHCNPLSVATGGK